MFSDLQQLKTLCLENFNGSLIDNTMEGMFSNCNNLISLNLPNLDFTFVYNIKNIFKGCHSLNYINLSNFKNSNILDFSYLFYDCVNLKLIDLRNFKGSTKENKMDYMFANCQKLTEINLLNLDLSNTININHMFDGCISLEKGTIINKKESLISDFS